MGSGEHPVPAVVGPPDVPSPSPSPARRLWPWIAGGLLAAVLGLALYVQPWVASVPAVPFEIVAPGPVTQVLAVNGRVAALRSLDLRPLVSGTLDDVPVAEGDAVAAGTEVVRIDPSAQQAAVRQALAGLDAALVSESEARATDTRYRSLGDVVSRLTLEDAARALQSATQNVARTRAALDAAQIQLGYFTIRAPMAGTILSLDIEPGQSVDPSTVLMTLADLSRLQVETDVDEAYATRIHPGQAAVLQLTGETALRSGRVGTVSQRVDAATGGLAVTLTFDAPVVAPVALTVTANIVVDSRDAAMTLPRAAIVTDATGTAVFVVVDGIARRRAVEMIDWPAGRLIVTSGVVAGDVAIADATGIVDGQAVADVRP